MYSSRCTLVALVFSLLVVSFSAPILASDCLDYRTHLHVIGTAETYGTCRHLIKVGNVIHTIAGSDLHGSGGLVIHDFADPENPVEIGHVSITNTCYCGALAGDIVVIGDAVWPSDWGIPNEGALHVVDIQNPGNPVVLSSLTMPGCVIDVVVVGEYVYAACQSGDLYYPSWIMVLVDISDPSVPLSVETYDIGAIGDVVSVDDYLLVANMDAGLRVIDITDPAVPVILEPISIPDGARYLAPHGGLLAVTSMGSAVHIVDPGISRDPPVIGSVTVPGYLGRPAVDGDRLVVRSDGGFAVIDISDVENPWVSTITEIYGSNQVILEGGLAYVGHGCLNVLDGLDGGSATYRARWQIAEMAYGVRCVGDLAYLADGDYGLLIYDIADFDNPELIGGCSFDGRAKDIVIEDQYAYIANGDGLVIVDITSSAFPTVTGSVDTPGNAGGVVVSANHAFVADLENDLQVISIVDPSNPQLGGNLSLNGRMRAITVQGDYLYLAGGWAGGLHIVDISDPADPAEIGSILTDGFDSDVALAGDHAFVADMEFGLVIYDVSQPEAPYEVLAMPMAYSTRYIDIVEDVAAVTTGSIITLLDISDAAMPQPLGAVPVANTASDVAIAGGGIVTTHYGLWVQTSWAPCTGLTDVQADPVPTKHPILRAAIPNPFNPQTKISYALAEPGRVTLRVFDVAGRLVDVLVDNEDQSAATHFVIWDGQDIRGRPSPSGTYFYRLETGGYNATKRMTLIR